MNDFRLIERTKRLARGACLAFVLFYPGCSSGGPDEDRECARDRDCAADERCVDEACVKGPARSECDAGCADGTRCVNDVCLATCTSRSDCAKDEVCSAWEFEDGSEDTLCSTFDGRFSACSDDAECDGANGFRCIEGTCTTACRSHSDCTSVGHCDRLGDGTYCVPGVPARRGGYFTPCPGGSADCATDDGFFCRSSGVGDLDGYCTADCTADDECPAGYRCGALRVPPCDRACGVEGSPNVPGCAPTAEIGAGLRYECGVLTAVRRVCERRTFCVSCETNEDCLGVAGQVCARDRSGEKICTFPCDPSFDSCPWGNASECGDFDAELGVPTCSHKFGSCRGDGRGCEPCTQDSDCGRNGICSSFGFSHERFCIDLTAPCDCEGDADANGMCTGHGCPETPDGLAMVCLASRGATDPLGNRCLGASTSSAATGSQQASCWRP